MAPQYCPKGGIGAGWLNKLKVVNGGPGRRVLLFPVMKHKPFRKPRIRKFGDVSRLTRRNPENGDGQGTQGGIPYDVT